MQTISEPKFEWIKSSLPYSLMGESQPSLVIDSEGYLDLAFYTTTTTTTTKSDTATSTKERENFHVSLIICQFDPQGDLVWKHNQSITRHASLQSWSLIIKIGRSIW